MPEQTSEKKKFEPIVITEAEYHDHRNGYDGVCLTCRDWIEGGIEPDARRYECEVCGQKTVYGVEEALLRGAVQISDSAP